MKGMYVKNKSTLMQRAPEAQITSGGSGEVSAGKKPIKEQRESMSNRLRISKGVERQPVPDLESDVVGQLLSAAGANGEGRTDVRPCHERHIVVPQTRQFRDAQPRSVRKMNLHESARDRDRGAAGHNVTFHMTRSLASPVPVRADRHIRLDEPAAVATDPLSSGRELSSSRATGRKAITVPR
jgi:hypothetical protein